MLSQKATVIMDAIVSKVKTVLSEAEEVLATAETHAETIDVNGVTYRYKLESEKEFLTPGGIVKLVRRVYQPDVGGKCCVPLDAAWGMEGQFATVEVRDAALYAVALGTPREAEILLAKCALFQPSATAIKHMAKQIGQWLEDHEDEVLTEIRAEEPIPDQTRVLCASMDGVNVLLSEPGKKKGRPNERPHEGASKEIPSPTCYKNAMVGSVSFYGEVPQAKTSPERLASRYAARMPEDRAPTLKAKFERELQDTESRLSDNVVRIVLCDGARGLWSYIDENSQYDGYEKLVDYHHTTEHLSKAAEAIFGKGSRKAQVWYDKYCSKLKGEDGGAECVSRSLDYYRRTAGLSTSRGAALDAERTFFARNAHRMDYAHFRGQGWPIGSGPVEAACKSVVKTRLCRSGMRWSRSGGQHILSLRTYVKSDRWTPLWNQYKRLQWLPSPTSDTT